MWQVRLLIAYFSVEIEFLRTRYVGAGVIDELTIWLLLQGSV